MSEKPNYKKTLTACYFGYITQAIVVNLAPVLFIVFRENYGLSYEKLSFLVLLNFVTQIFVDMLSIRIADRVGYRRYIIIAHSFAVVGLCMLGILPALLPSNAVYPALIAATLTYAAGSGIIEVLVSPIVEAVPGDAKSSSMALLHGFYCWGQVLVVLLTTLLLKLLGHSLWYLIPLMWALIPLQNIFRFARAPIAPVVADGEKKIPLRSLLTKKLFLFALIMMTCSGASELAMSQWASMFAEKGLGVSKTVGDLLGPCMFGVLMGCGRTLYGLFGQRLKPERLLVGSALLCVCCYLAAAFSPNAVVGLAGCALCGLSVSLMWPGMLSISAAEFPGGGTPMFGTMAVFGDIGCSLGPWITGMVSGAVISSSEAANAESAGLKAGLLAAVIFPLIMLVLLPYFIKKDAEKANPADTEENPADTE